MSLSLFVLVKNFFCIYTLLNLLIGQLVKIYRGVQALTSKRLILGGVSFRVISSPMNAPSGNGFIGSWDQNWGVQTKNGDFWPFLAFEGRFGGLKDPPEVRVEDKT